MKGLSLLVAGFCATALSPLLLHAQDRSRPAASGTFFDETFVDFWDSDWKRIRASKSDRPINDWRDVSISKDGNVKTYTPPPVVTRLLENPTKATALAYLRWQRQRIARIRAAQRLVQLVQLQDKAAKLSKLIRSHEATVQIDFYTKDGCPYCAVQKRIFAKFTELLPQAVIRTLELTGQPELPVPLGITSVPTMILRINGTEVRRSGVTSSSQLLDLIKSALPEEESDDR